MYVEGCEETVCFPSSCGRGRISEGLAMFMCAFYVKETFWEDRLPDWLLFRCWQRIQSLEAKCAALESKVVGCYEIFFYMLFFLPGFMWVFKFWLYSNTKLYYWLKQYIKYILRSVIGVRKKRDGNFEKSPCILKFRLLRRYHFCITITILL